MISYHRLYQYRNGTSTTIIVLFVTILYNHQNVHSHLTSKNFNLQSLATLATSKFDAFFSNQIKNNNQQLFKVQTRSNVIQIIEKSFRSSTILLHHRYLFGYQTWYKALMRETDNDLTTYLENPVNEFLLMKRLGNLRRVLDMTINQENDTISIYE